MFDFLNPFPYTSQSVVKEAQSQKITYFLMKPWADWGPSLLGLLFPSPLVNDRYFSHLWGKLTSVQFPWPFQSVITNLYALAFGCNLDESEMSISNYPSLAHFFRRKLKDGARPIDESAQLVCEPVGLLFLIA
jgi:hypothetical protein